jgi:hypothetical protein
MYILIFASGQVFFVMAIDTTQIQNQNEDTQSNSNGRLITHRTKLNSIESKYINMYIIHLHAMHIIGKHYTTDIRLKHPCITIFY